jgi:RNA-binding protein|tara:strand:- start:307 stop:576 length:270 start_codon:yes stop_codon:yes gene_type:complete
MSNLSNSERKNLRTQAHPLKPVVMIGQLGLTEAVLSEIDIALNAHELIKVSIRGADKDERIKQGKVIENLLGAEVVSQIGSITILYRPV